MDERLNSKLIDVGIVVALVSYIILGTLTSKYNVLATILAILTIFGTILATFGIFNQKEWQLWLKITVTLIVSMLIISLLFIFVLGSLVSGLSNIW